jgi:hypothetical protein
MGQSLIRRKVGERNCSGQDLQWSEDTSLSYCSHGHCAHPTKFIRQWYIRSVNLGTLPDAPRRLAGAIASLDTVDVFGWVVSE